MTWALVIVGWLVVHWLTARRTRRQEELAAVGAIERRIEALKMRAITYYTTPPSEASEAEESHLKHEMQAVAMALKGLRDRKPKKYDLSAETIAFRRAITEDPFESKDRRAFKHGNHQVMNLWLTSSKLIDRLQQEFEIANPN